MVAGVLDTSPVDRSKVRFEHGCRPQAEREIGRPFEQTRTALRLLSMMRRLMVAIVLSGSCAAPTAQERVIEPTITPDTEFVLSRKPQREDVETSAEYPIHVEEK